jgi:hypothetical protein
MDVASAFPMYPTMPHMSSMKGVGVNGMIHRLADRKRAGPGPNDGRARRKRTEANKPQAEDGSGGGVGQALLCGYFPIANEPGDLSLGRGG